MREPPQEPGDVAMVLFTGLEERQAQHFLDRLNAAIDYWFSMKMQDEPT